MLPPEWVSPRSRLKGSSRNGGRVSTATSHPAFASIFPDSRAVSAAAAARSFSVTSAQSRAHFVAPEIFDKLSLPPGCNAPSIVRFSPGGELLGATVPRLIAEITSADKLDYSFLTDFFMTYRQFVTPHDLLGHLVSRYIWAVNRGDVPSRAVRVRTFVALRHWILNYFGDDWVPSPVLRHDFVAAINSMCLSDKIALSPTDRCILGELKRYWIRALAMYWDMPMSELMKSAEQCFRTAISPGGLIGTRSMGPTLSSGPASVAPSSRRRPHTARSKRAPKPAALFQGPASAVDPHGVTGQLASSPIISSVHDATGSPPRTPRTPRTPRSAGFPPVAYSLPISDHPPANRPPSLLEDSNSSSDSSGEAEFGGKSAPSADDAGQLRKGFLIRGGTLMLSDEQAMVGQVIPPTPPRELNYSRDNTRRPFKALRKMFGNTPEITRSLSQLAMVNPIDHGRDQEVRIDILAASVVDNYRNLSSKYDMANSASQDDLLSSDGTVNYTPRDPRDDDGDEEDEDEDEDYAHRYDGIAEDTTVESIVIRAPSPESSVSSTPVPELGRDQNYNSGSDYFGDSRLRSSYSPYEHIAQVSDQMSMRGSIIDDSYHDDGRSFDRDNMSLAYVPSVGTSSDRAFSFGSLGHRVVSDTRFDVSRSVSIADSVLESFNNDAAVLNMSDLRLTLRNSPASSTDYSASVGGRSAASSLAVDRRPRQLSRRPPLNTYTPYVDQGTLHARDMSSSSESSASFARRDVSGKPMLRRQPGGANLKQTEHRRQRQPSSYHGRSSSPSLYGGSVIGRYSVDSLSSARAGSYTGYERANPFGAEYQGSDSDKENFTAKRAASTTDTSGSSEVYIGIPGISADIAREIQKLAKIPDDDTGGEDPIQVALMKLEGTYEQHFPQRQTWTGWSTREREAGHGEDLVVRNRTTLSTTNSNHHKDTSQSSHVASTMQSLQEFSMEQPNTTSSFSIHSDQSDGKALSEHFGHSYERSTDTSAVLDSRSELATSLADEYPSRRTSTVASETTSVNSSMISLSIHLPFILQYSSKQLAEQFTLIDRDSIAEIDWKELIDLNWKQDVAAVQDWLEFVTLKDPRPVELIITRFNLMTGWVTSEILLTRQLHERIRVIVKFIHIAAETRRLQNYSTFMQITLALASSTVQRLATTWSRVPRADLALFKALEEVASPLRNFKNLRLEMDNARLSAGCVPFVGLFLSDLTFNAQTSAHLVDSAEPSPRLAESADDIFEAFRSDRRLLNIERFRTSAAIVKKLLQFLEAAAVYALKVDREVVSKCVYISCLNDDEIDECLTLLNDP
ncbi:ras guanine nucleotide exchange factor domain-containing protein [Dipodascopsis tothii]|uniref:ras guanine nucleotide exchange factor domain-containing protein n=1 Tax=Dipodascopsis tothii TaxID=44089 RepID=UPI0034CFA5C0